MSRRVSEDEILDRAAGLSYYFVFALPPTLLFLTALVGLLPVPDLLSQLLEYADRMLPGDAASLLRRTLAEVVSGASGGLLSIGMVAALWVASSGMLSIMDALNVVYRVGARRPWWKSRLIALGLTVGFSLFTLTALLLLVSDASRQRREDRDDVAFGERPSGQRVLTVHEHDARKIGGDPEAP